MWQKTGTCAYGNKCKFAYAGNAPHVQNSSSQGMPGDMGFQRQGVLGMFQQMATDSVENGLPTESRGITQESRGSAALAKVSRRTQQAPEEEAGRLFVTQRLTRIKEDGGLHQSSDLYSSFHPEAIAREHRAACSQSATLQ